MEEIKYEEFLRLENGKIVKYGEKTDTKVENNRYIDYSGEYEWKSCITKHSQNIIDLIEVGDYVNGYKVLDVMETMNIGELHLEMTSNYTNEEIGDCTIYDKDIKTILTKEQFETNCYKIGGEEECM